MSFQSALDSVWNMVAHPLAGIDKQEMVDTRELFNALNDLLNLDPISGTWRNLRCGNFPRKFNIADRTSGRTTPTPTALWPAPMPTRASWDLMWRWEGGGGHVYQARDRERAW